MAKTKEEVDPVNAVLANIEKQLGRRGEKSPFSRFKNIEVSKEPVISFGISAVNDASYCGGIPRGRIVELFGPESSGKSLLSLYLIGQAQKQGLNCVLIDVEQSFDPVWAAQHGVNVDELIYSNETQSGEEALEYTCKLCASGVFGLVVIDSTAALIPAAELEGSLTDKERVGAQSRMLSRGLRKVVGACGSGNATAIFINQTREKIGVMYGNPETTPGGKSLKFYSHQRIRVQGKAKIKVVENGEDVIVGQTSSVSFVKNKTARPFGKCEFKIVFDPKSLNPVVMLANALRSAKIVTVYKGIFRVAKEVLDNKKPIETSSTTMIELADWMIKESNVLPLLDKLIEEVEDDPSAVALDDAILEMKTDPSKITSPTDANVSIEAQQVDDDPTVAEDEVTEEDVLAEVAED